MELGPLEQRFRLNARYSCPVDTRRSRSTHETRQNSIQLLEFSGGVLDHVLLHFRYFVSETAASTVPTESVLVESFAEIRSKLRVDGPLAELVAGVCVQTSVGVLAHAILRDVATEFSLPSAKQTKSREHGHRDCTIDFADSQITPDHARSSSMEGDSRPIRQNIRQ